MIFAPHKKKNKLVGVYDQIPSGMTGVQTFFHIMFSFYKQGVISLDTLIELTSAGPARIFGLKGKGAIKVGYDADMVIVDEDAEVEIRDEHMLSACGWTPYHGEKYPGEILGVVALGQLYNSRLATSIA